MKEELQKEIIDKVIDKVKEEVAEIKSSLKERIKLPILVAYCIILVIYNWDVLFYFVLESGIPSQKIAYINKNFTNDYHHRFLVPLMLSCLSTFAFPVLQVGINILFKDFKNENDQLIKEKEKADVEHIKALTDLKSSNKERDILQTEVDLKKKEILDIKQELLLLDNKYLEITKEKDELTKNLKESDDNLYGAELENEEIISIFKAYTDEKYNANKFNYFKNFKKFYNYFLGCSEKEKVFIKKLINKFTYNRTNTIKSSEIAEIDVYDLVDTRIIFKNFVECGIIDYREFISEITLNNKGKEVIYIFRLIEGGLLYKPEN